MLWRLRFVLIALTIAFTITCLSRIVEGQVAQRQRPQSVVNNPLNPLPLSHLYWHFLEYQKHLDMKAAAISASGGDGSRLRNTLQRQLGFTDGDYALIRTSSTRLAANVQALDGQAMVIVTAGSSPSSRNQLQMLTAQREKDINAEVSYLKSNLAPRKVAALEAFILKTFPSRPTAARWPVSVQSLTPKGAQ